MRNFITNILNVINDNSNMPQNCILQEGLVILYNVKRKIWWQNSYLFSLGKNKGKLRVHYMWIIYLLLMRNASLFLSPISMKWSLTVGIILGKSWTISSSKNLKQLSNRKLRFFRDDLIIFFFLQSLCKLYNDVEQHKEHKHSEALCNEKHHKI